MYVKSRKTPKTPWRLPRRQDWEVGSHEVSLSSYTQTQPEVHAPSESTNMCPLEPLDELIDANPKSMSFEIESSEPSDATRLFLRSDQHTDRSEGEN